jgi:predicted Zn-dependent peptidase
LAAHGPTEGELTRAKAISGAQMLMGSEAPSARAEARAGQIFLRDRLVPLDDIRARIERVAPEEVQAIAAAALLGPMCAATIGPKAGHAALDAFHGAS